MSSYLTSAEHERRRQCARFVYSITTLSTILLGIFLVWSLRSMILPTIIGMGMAYICIPLLTRLKSRGLSHFWSVIILSILFSLVFFSVLNLAARVIPDQREELEILVRARYKINEKFNRLMGIDRSNQGNSILQSLFGRDLEPLRERIDKALQLSPENRRIFEDYYLAGRPGDTRLPNRYLKYYQGNRRRDLENERARILGKSQLTEPLRPEPNIPTGESSVLLTIFNAVSLWFLTPLVFLTLLFDNGVIKKKVVKLVPNRYFEVTLTVINNINLALGRYLRGTAIECFLVGANLTLCLFLVGLDMQWAAAIGIVAGLANAIPFLGPAIGLLIGLFYAIMAEDITPILPFINQDNLILAIIAAVALVQLLDNAVYQPYILGNAVDLHPLTVVLGVMGGAVLFGFAGMLFAIPAIMVLKVIVFTLFSQLRAYYII